MLKLTEHSELDSKIILKNMVVKIDMNVFRIQGIILKTNEAANWQKTMRSQLNLKFIGYSKKSVTMVKVSLPCLSEHACIDL